MTCAHSTHTARTQHAAEMGIPEKANYSITSKYIDDAAGNTVQQTENRQK